MCKFKLAPVAEEKTRTVVEGHTAATALAGALQRLAQLTSTPIVSGDFRACPESCFDAALVPKVSIQDYALKLLAWLNCSPECFVMAFVYIDRLIRAHSGHAVSVRNIHRLLLSSVMVAAKVHDDVHYANSSFALVGGVSCEELNSLEATFLREVGWRTHVAEYEFDDAADTLLDADAPFVPRTTNSCLRRETLVDEDEEVAFTRFLSEDPAHAFLGDNDETLVNEEVAFSRLLTEDPPFVPDSRPQTGLRLR